MTYNSRLSKIYPYTNLIKLIKRNRLFHCVEYNKTVFIEFGIWRVSSDLDKEQVLQNGRDRNHVGEDYE